MQRFAAAGIAIGVLLGACSGSTSTGGEGGVPVEVEAAPTVAPTPEPRVEEPVDELPLIDCERGAYLNSAGRCVSGVGWDPNGATAKCRDEMYSYSEQRQGQCSHHGGVLERCLFGRNESSRWECAVERSDGDGWFSSD